MNDLNCKAEAVAAMQQKIRAAFLPLGLYTRMRKKGVSCFFCILTTPQREEL